MQSTNSTFHKWETRKQVRLGLMSKIHLQTGWMSCTYMFHSHTHTHSWEFINICCDACTHSEIKVQRAAGWGSAARVNVQTKVFGLTLLHLNKACGYEFSTTQVFKFNANMFHIMGFAMIHFANQIEPGCTNRFGYCAWFLHSSLGVSSPSAERKES